MWRALIFISWVALSCLGKQSQNDIRNENTFKARSPWGAPGTGTAKSQAIFAIGSHLCCSQCLWCSWYQEGTLCPLVPYPTQSQQHCVKMTTSSFRHFLLLVFIPRSHSSGFLLPLMSVFSSPSLAPPLKTCNCWCSLGFVLGSGWFIQHLWRICSSIYYDNLSILAPYIWTLKNPFQ